MKTIWEEKDIVAGMYVYNASLCDIHSKPLDVPYLASVCYQVGFIGSNKGMALISVCDGMVIKKDSMQSMADDLNEKGYNKLPYPIFTKVMDYLRDRIEGNR